MDLVFHFARIGAERSQVNPAVGVCASVNRRYCTAVTIREKICTPNIELLSVSFRPFYLPQEFPQVFITVVYIHPKANNVKATNIGSDVVHGLKNISPEAPNFILGDFNDVSLNVLSNFHRYIICPTRHRAPDCDQMVAFCDQFLRQCKHFLQALAHVRPTNLEFIGCAQHQHTLAIDTTF